MDRSKHSPIYAADPDNPTSRLRDSQALDADLSILNLTLLQYTDDLFLCSPSYALTIQHRATCLNLLSSHKHRVSPTKAQITTPKVKYLSLTLTPTSRSIYSLSHKALLHNPQVPTTKQQILSFLSLTNFFSLDSQLCHLSPASLQGVQMFPIRASQCSYSSALFIL